MRSDAYGKKTYQIALAVKYSQYLKGTASWLVDDEPGKDAVEENVPVREIGSPMATLRDFGQTVKTLEELGDDSVRGLHSVLLEKVKPD
jgi:hypothetical protein